MYTSFNSHIGAENEPLSNEMIVITDKNIDGNFLLHHFISNALNNDERVCLFGFAQTFTHYLSACHKIGLNLQKYVDSQQFIFIDALQWIFDSFVGSTDNNILCNIKDSNSSLKPMIDVVLKNTSNYQGPSLVLFDDISSLVNIGVTVQSISNLIHYCKTLVHQKDISFVLLAHVDDEEEDPEYALLHGWLKRYATLEINVSSLKTGYSRDLSGEMNILRKSNVQYSTLSKRLHFKLHDKGVKFFAPGTSAAVL